MAKPNNSEFSSGAHLRMLPSAIMRLIARTVLPKGPYGTGQPCALTQNVLPTPKSLFDCITAGENPALSSVAITSRQVVPADARNVLPAESISHRPPVTVIPVPSRGML